MQNTTWIASAVGDHECLRRCVAMNLHTLLRQAILHQLLNSGEPLPAAGTSAHLEEKKIGLNHILARTQKKTISPFLRTIVNCGEMVKKTITNPNSWLRPRHDFSHEIQESPGISKAKRNIRWPKMHPSLQKNGINCTSIPTMGIHLGMC